MSIEQIFVLAIVQGLTEFLPVSSSGHLILIPAFTGWQDQGTATDVMVHVGSLFAVLVYFRRDVAELFQGVRDLLAGKITPLSKRVSFILLATVPALVMGFILKVGGFAPHLRSVELIAWNAVIFGALLYVADRFGPRLKTMQDITAKPVFVIGLAQALALIPGVSRSGITITAARTLGFERSEAARFSFLLGIPAISIAGIFTAIEAWHEGGGVPADAMLAALLTFFAALAAIAFLMAVVQRTSFLVFVIYRFALAFVLFAMLYDWFPGYLPSLS